MPSFQPRYILDNEVATYGLPLATDLPTVMNLVDAASTLIDEYCGRISGDGQGSLVYTTYVERVQPPEQRNQLRVSYQPLVGLSSTDVTTLTNLNAASGNHFYTGFTPSGQSNVFPGVGTLVTPILAASGRYGYRRNNQMAVYPDLNYGINPLMIASMFGGPPNWTNIDITAIDVDTRTGECWFPSGLYLSQYTEILVTYNAGYDPTNMPPAIKHACAALVRNFISRGGGTFGMKSYSVGKVSASFTENLVDLTTASMLQPYTRVVSV